MKPPKQNTYLSLIGTIVIMWLMVGYVYLLTPLETLPSMNKQPSPVDVRVPAKANLQNSARVGDASLMLETVKSHYQPQEPVVVLAHLAGLSQDKVESTLASLLIEGDIQVLGPITFSRNRANGEFVARILFNPATGQPLMAGSYKVVVRVGTDLVAAVAFEIAGLPEQLAWQSRPVGTELKGSTGSRY